MHHSKLPECYQDQFYKLLQYQFYWLLKQLLFWQLFEQLPEITYWDFAGQLEYSAAHDFFLSSRQAVYVIVFSVVDDRDSQIHQVA